MSAKQKLELTWIGKDKRPRLEPRILVEVPEKSYHAAQRHSENDIFDNMLIHGDNLQSSSTAITETSKSSTTRTMKMVFGSWKTIIFGSSAGVIQSPEG